MLLGAVESDDLIGGSGADLIDGGPTAGPNDDFGGLDRAIYTDHATAVTVHLDGIANDGSVDEGDNVLRNIDVVIGGAGNDRLVGNLRANELDGRGGQDTLIGSGGADRLSGGRGNDTIWAGRGNDTVEGEVGDDWIAAGPGGDDILGVTSTGATASTKVSVLTHTATTPSLAETGRTSCWAREETIASSAVPGKICSWARVAGISSFPSTMERLT